MPEIPNQQQKLILFGPFEADLRSQELKKQGVRLRVPGQPFQILKMLLERPGELVTREELRQTLWPSDTFVDFDHGLSAAVNKLRQTLGDDADAPRYIETLPKRGYRFVGVVAPPVQVVPVPLGRVEREERWGKTSRGWKLWAAGVASVAVCFLIVAGFFWRRSAFAPPRVLGYRQLTTDRRAKGQPCDSAVSSRVVTDGARVFFSENGYGLRQVSTNGGEVAEVSNPLGCFDVFDISPDKTELLGTAVTDPTAADNPLWVLSVVTGLAQRIGDLRGHAAAWSPDGQRIAYVTGSVWGAPNDLYIAAKDGGQARKLARVDSGVVASILWSSDEKVLRIGVVAESHKNSIWEVSSDGTNLHLARLLPQEAGCCLGGMSSTPDGKYLLAQVGSAIWALREAQSVFRNITNDVVQLTSGPISYQNPALNPDGKKIFTIGGRARGELLRYDLNSHRLEPYLSGISAEHLDFSRDGKWVTYVTFPEGILWRSRVDGSERMQLTTPPLHAVLPRWSPDRTRIAFSGWLFGRDIKIYVVSAEGGKPEMISQSQEIEVDATWTPDGNSLVFGGSMWFDAQRKISSVDLRTRRVSVIPGSEGMDSPRISPDGRFVFAEIARNHKSFLFDQLSQKWSEVTGRLTGSVWPEWSSDSKYVYLGRDPELPAGSFHVYRLRVADRKIEPVATVDLPDGLIGVWGGWMSTAPDGAPLLLRDLSIQEIYALDVDLP